MWPRCIENVTKVVRYEKYDLCETRYMLYINRDYHKYYDINIVISLIS